jgi:CMP-N-acetylneuraminic acid synthetase
MKTIAIIPARGGSKRLLHKNILDMGGLPLVVHSILFAIANSEIIDEIYVSTDDVKIKEISLQYGAKVIDRPAELSTDFEPTISALKHVLENISDQVSTVVLLQSTNPLRPVNLLKEAFQKYQDIKCDSLFTVSRNHQKMGKINNHKFIPFNYTIGQRSQELEPLYFENGLLYISKAKLILENTIISEDAYPMIVDHPFATVDIDTQDDFDYAHYLLKKYKTK